MMIYRDLTRHASEAEVTTPCCDCANFIICNHWTNLGTALNRYVPVLGITIYFKIIYDIISFTVDF